MKKCLPILFVLVFLALILQVVVNVFIKEKNTEYVLNVDGVKYNIQESMKVIDDVSYYDFKIEDSNQLFYTFSFKENFNKQTEIITDIKYISTDNLSCMFPIYKRGQYGDVYCLLNGEQVSYSYLRQIDSNDIFMVTNKLKSLGYANSKWEDNVSKSTRLEKEGRGINFYQDNILTDYTFLIWRYKGLYILKNDDSVVKDFLEYDQYENNLSALVGRYYVTVDFDESSSVSELSYYNTKEYGRGSIVLPEKTSDNYYFNGVYDGKLYMTDIDAEKQYEIVPAYEKVTEVGNSSIGFLRVKDGQLVNVSKDKFLKEKVYFTDYVLNEDISGKYGDVEIIKNRKFYYYKTADGKVYRVHEDNIEKPELLFKLDNFTEWKVRNGEVLAVAGDTVYFYTDEWGLLPIAVNSELKYNHYNICDFWKK